MSQEDLTRDIKESISDLVDLTARIDERVKMMMDANTKTYAYIGDLENRLRNLLEKNARAGGRIEGIDTRVNEVRVELYHEIDALNKNIERTKNSISNFEGRLRLVENSGDRQENRWKLIIGYVLQTGWVVLVCYLLYKLNLQSPPLP